MTKDQGRALGWILVVVILLLAAGRGAFDKRDKRSPEKIAQDAAIEQARQEVLASARNDPPPPPSVGAAEVRMMGRHRLLESLKDPDSADIRNDRAYRLGGGWAYCGEVNARNSFGGYTGFRRFIAGPASGQPVVIEGGGMMIQSEFDDAYDRMCVL